jgi:hypothetical protein
MTEIAAILSALGILGPLQVFLAGILTITAFIYLLKKL